MMLAQSQIDHGSHCKPAFRRQSHEIHSITKLKTDGITLIPEQFGQV
jgi:hypothetical protein